MRPTVLLLALAACSGADRPEDVVLTGDGEVQGLLDADTRSFLGIPYAAPPVGELRFATPAPHEAWDRLQAVAIGNACRQPSYILIETNSQLSEDCLVLNVFTPRPAPERAPVMVWLHGGAFIVGSANEPLYDGRALARRGVVVVTLNYRLGPLGYLAFGGTSGRQGIEDQRVALRWVKQNIAAFGGDPARVTLFGESAGAISVYIHMADPASAGLFQRAIIESGFTTGSGIGDFLTDEQAAMQGGALAAALGCTDLACLREKEPTALGRALPGQELRLGAPRGALWWPAGVAPLRAFEGGNFNKVPVLVGTTADEGTLFELLAAPATEDDYRAQVEAQFGTDAPAVLARYPVSTFGSPVAAASAVLGDAAFVSDTRRTARALVAAGVPVWRYSFERVPGFQPIAGLGAHHGGELRFVFGSTLLRQPLTADEEALGSLMRDQWVAFARDGKPGPGWPAYEATTDPYLRIADGLTPAAGLKTAESDFWDSIYAKHR